MTLNEVDQVVLVSDEEAAGFAAATGSRAWYRRHEPIRPSGWRRFAAGLLMTSGAVLTVSSFAASKVKGLLPAVPSPALRISGLQPIRELLQPARLDAEDVVHEPEMLRAHAS